MCEPTTIMAGAMIVGTAFTAMQQREQGKHQKGVAEYNSRVKENEAQDIRREGVEKENIQRRKTAELVSKQRAQLGAANIDLSAGSALQLQEETQELGEVDALRIRSNVESRAQATEQSAGLIQSQGEFAESASQGQAFGTLLSGTSAALGTGVADKWFTPQSAALTPNTFDRNVPQGV